jgi:hypothetical protein
METEATTKRIANNARLRLRGNVRTRSVHALSIVRLRCRHRLLKNDRSVSCSRAVSDGRTSWVMLANVPTTAKKSKMVTVVKTVSILEF